MYCQYCGKQIDDGSAFCPYCGRKLPRQPKKKRNGFGKIAILIALVLVVAIAAMIVVRFVRGGDGSDEDRIVLLLDRNSFSIGEDAVVHATIRLPFEVKNKLQILDENGDVLYDYSSGESDISQSGENEYILQTELKLESDEARVGLLRAVCGRNESRSMTYYIEPEVTEEMLQRLSGTAESLGEFSETLPSDSYYSNESLEKVLAHLKGDPNVADAQINNGAVIYQTVDGLTGSYGLGYSREGCAGAETATLEEAWEIEEKGGDNSYRFVHSLMTMTNSRIMKLSFCDDPEFEDYNLAVEKMLSRLSGNLENSSYQSLKEPESVYALGNGNYTDCGLVVFNTHGSLLNRSEGGQMLVMKFGDMLPSDLPSLSAKTDGSEEGDLWGERKCNLWSGEQVFPEQYRLVYDVSEDTSSKYTIRGTTNYIEAGLSDQLFDNTILFFTVCFAGADKELLDILYDHEAAIVVAAENSVNIVYSGIVLEEICEILTDNNKAPGQPQTIDSIQTAGMNDSDENRFHDMFYRYKADEIGVPDNEYSNYLQAVHNKKNVTYLGDLETENHSSGFSAGEKITIEEYSQLIWDYLKATTYFGRGESPNVERSRLFVNYRFTGKSRFHMNGIGTSISGKVIMNAERAPLPGVEITLYRWLNHEFTEVQKVLTDQDGVYSFSDLPYGHYAVRVNYERLEESEVLEYNVETQGFPTFHLYLTGFTGFVIDDETEEPIANADVQFRTGQDFAAVTTDDRGVFTISGIAPGDYEIYGTKKGYKDSEHVSITVEKENLKSIEEPLRMKRLENNATGVVLDSLTETPVEGVTVTWEDENGVPGDNTTSTDEDGSFLLEGLSEGEVTLHFSKEEYEETTVDLTSGGDEPDIDLGQVYLDPSIEEYYSSVLKEYREYEECAKEGIAKKDYSTPTKYAEERKLNGLLTEEVEWGHDICYRFIDINNDRHNELVIATDELKVLDIYTRGEEGPVHVLDYDRYQWLGYRYTASFDIDNNRILMHGSYSAFSEYVRLFNFAPGASKAEYTGRYIHDTDPNTYDWDYTYEDNNHNTRESSEEEFSQYKRLVEETYNNEKVYNKEDWSLLSESGVSGGLN